MSAHHPHTAKNIVFTCIDDRLTPATASFITGLDGGAFHPAIAGGAAAFLSEDDRPTALKQVVAAYKINDVTSVYLQSHADCGAYRLAGVTFDSPQQELTRLYQDLDQAAMIVKEALVDSGAPAETITVHTTAVDATGTPLDRPDAR